MGIIDDILAKEPEQRHVEFIKDRALREDLSTAQLDVEEAKLRLTRVPSSDKDAARDLRREIGDLDQLIEELWERAGKNLIRFTFAALAPEVFDELKGTNRPTQHQLTEARKEQRPSPDWNNDTFEPVLVASACVKVETPSGTSDGLSVEDAETMWKSAAYNRSERNDLFNTALSAQLTRTRIDRPKGG